MVNCNTQAQLKEVRIVLPRNNNNQGVNTWGARDEWVTEVYFSAHLSVITRRLNRLFLKYNNNMNNNMNVQLMLRYSGQQKATGGVEPCIDQWASLDFQFNSSYRSEKLNLVYPFPCLPYAFPLLICITSLLHTKESHARKIIRPSLLVSCSVQVSSDYAS